MYVAIPGKSIARVFEVIWGILNSWTSSHILRINQLSFCIALNILFTDDSPHNFQMQQLQNHWIVSMSPCYVSQTKFTNLFLDTTFNAFDRYDLCWLFESPFFAKANGTMSRYVGGVREIG